METSKEELQSLNEESATVNAELQSRIEELSKANDDMKNLLDSTEIATIFLDTELCIRRFTLKATEIIPLAGTDSGRPVKHFASNLVDVDLTRYAEAVLRDLAVREIEVKCKDHRTFVLRVRPYRTVANVIDGVVLTFEDVTDRKKADEAMRILARFPSENPSPVVRIRADGMLLYANDASESLLGAWGCRVGRPVPDQWRQRVAEALRAGTLQRAEIELSDRALSFEIVPVADAGYANLYGRDVSERKRADSAAREKAAGDEKTIRELKGRLKDTTS